MATDNGRTRGLLEHPALLYERMEDFLGVMVPYVSAGIEREEVVFVAARGVMVGALRDELGTRAAGARLEDTDEWYPHPATRLRAFNELITGELGAGAKRFRLAGEPVWPAGPPELVREWQRYESVLNAVLAPFPATLVCLYDASRLDGSILDGARRTHPVVFGAGGEQPSGEFVAPEEFLPGWNPSLDPPPSSAVRMPEVADLSFARWFLQEEALRAGIEPKRAADLVLAANEVLTNAVQYANGLTALWAWVDDGEFICQIEDRGQGLADSLAGYRPPGDDIAAGRGLWLARQLVDLLQIVPGPSGTAVRLHIRQG
ncbi:MAG: anti-sigma factor RsbA family regulatory protein [Actinomycetota bacterium]